MAALPLRPRETEERIFKHLGREPVRERVAEAFASPDPKVRLSAAKLLVVWPLRKARGAREPLPSGYRPILAKAMKDPGPQVREKASAAFPALPSTLAAKEPGPVGRVVVFVLVPVVVFVLAFVVIVALQRDAK